MTADDDYSQSVYLMYPANWPDDVEAAHCTLLFIGEIPELDAKPEQILEVLRNLNLRAPGSVATNHTEFFGPEKDIPVVTLDSSLLALQRVFVEEALADKLGIFNASEYKVFRPHITVNPEGAYESIPEQIDLGGLELWWGLERLPI